MPWNSERIWVTGETFPYSNSQVKRAGDRIRRAAATAEPIMVDDYVLLDLYRSSHYPTLRHVHERLGRLLHRKLAMNPRIVTVAARPLKTHVAITAKLVREKTRLNLMQDIAGSRIVALTREQQNTIAEAILDSLKGLQPRVAKDALDGDVLGYRALHIVVTTNEPGIGQRFAEIQLRTAAADAWAQVVESLDDSLGSDLKHGVGPAEWLAWLLELSTAFASAEGGQRVTIPKPPTTPLRP